MKEAKIGNDFYAFELEPYVIEADLTGIENVFVQEEKYDEYLELNPELEGLLKKKNFLLKAVNQTPWEPYINPSIPEPEPEPISVSIVVDTQSVEETYEYGEEGYAFVPKEYSTDPVGYEEYVTVTVGESEYYEGMLLAEGTYNVTYTLEDGDGYVGDTASYTITVAEAAPVMDISFEEDTITHKNFNYAWEGEPQAVTGAPNGATIVYSSEDSDIVVQENQGQPWYYTSNEGTYTITATVSADGYETTSISYDLVCEYCEQYRMIAFDGSDMCAIVSDFDGNGNDLDELVLQEEMDSEYETWYKPFALVSRIDLNEPQKTNDYYSFEVAQRDGYDAGDSENITIGQGPQWSNSRTTIYTSSNISNLGNIVFYDDNEGTNVALADLLSSDTIVDSSLTYIDTNVGDSNLTPHFGLAVDNYTNSTGYNLVRFQVDLLDENDSSIVEEANAIDMFVLVYVAKSISFLPYTLTYNYNDNNMTASCTGIEESDVTSIEIPDTVEYNGNTYTVNNIGYEAFKNCTSLTRVEISDSVVALGVNAFIGCTNLTDIIVGKGVTNVYNGAFAAIGSSNNKLNLWMKPFTPPTMGNDMFYQSHIGTLHVTENNTAYDNHFGSNQWDTWTWDAVVDDIPLLNYEFDEDNNTVAITGTDYPLTVINIPKTVTKDNTTYTVNSVRGFSGKTSITEVNFPTYVSGDDDITVGINAFSGTHVTSVHIPENIVSSGYMFYNCTYLDQVIIEDGSYNFGGADFGLPAGSGTSPITQFILMHTTPPQVSSDLFFNTTPSNAYLHVPTGTLSDYEASGWNSLGFDGIVEGILQAIFPSQFGSVDDPQPLEIDITNQQPTYGEGNAVFDLSDIPLPTVTCNDTQGWHWTCEIVGQTSGNVITVNTTVTNGVPVVTGSTNPNDGQTYQSVPCDLTDTWTIEYYFETESNDDGGMPLASDSRSIEIQFINQS